MEARFRAPKNDEEMGSCNWCWAAKAQRFWVKRPEGGGAVNYKKEVAVPVCHTCENTIRRNSVG